MSVSTNDVLMSWCANTQKSVKRAAHVCRVIAPTSDAWYEVATSSVTGNGRQGRSQQSVACL